MALIFLLYSACFVLTFFRKRNAAYIMLVLSTLASLALFAYHTDSALELNF